jgi:nucleoside-diphosphate-sugar epimerase
MKIAITGHTAGIGQALTKVLSQDHEIVGLSKRDGYNIRSTAKIAGLIEPCDMFINNAQEGYAQTELLFEVVRRWQDTNKTIMIISTMMTQEPISALPGLDMDQYRIQKIALEQAVIQIRHQYPRLKIVIVRPGNIATSPNKTVPPSADVNQWAETLINIINLAGASNMAISDISLGPI